MINVYRGYGRRYLERYKPPIQGLRGYTYIGHCRCGHGPDAYYRMPEGRVVHASQVFGMPAAPTKEQEIEQLKTEKEMLEQRLKEIDETLKKME